MRNVNGPLRNQNTNFVFDAGRDPIQKKKKKSTQNFESEKPTWVLLRNRKNKTLSLPRIGFQGDVKRLVDRRVEVRRFGAWLYKLVIARSGKAPPRTPKNRPSKSPERGGCHVRQFSDQKSFLCLYVFLDAKYFFTVKWFASYQYQIDTFLLENCHKNGTYSFVLDIFINADCLSVYVSFKNKNE